MNRRNIEREEVQSISTDKFYSKVRWKRRRKWTIIIIRRRRRRRIRRSNSHHKGFKPLKHTIQSIPWQWNGICSYKKNILRKVITHNTFIIMQDRVRVCVCVCVLFLGGGRGGRDTFGYKGRLKGKQVTTTTVNKMRWKYLWERWGRERERKKKNCHHHHHHPWSSLMCSVNM